MRGVTVTSHYPIARDDRKIADRKIFLSTIFLSFRTLGWSTAKHLRRTGAKLQDDFMADTGMENFAATPGGATPRALWHTIQRRIASRTSLAGAQVAAIFGLLLLLQIAFGVLAPWGISLGSWWDYAHMLTLGASLAPPTLLALWAVLGPQPIAVRLPLTLWLATILYLAIGYGEKRNGGNAADGLLFVTAWLTAFMLIQMPLWLLRAIRRWRVISLTHQPELAGTIKDAWGGGAGLPSGQFTLRALLGWTLAAAVSLAALRCLSPASAFDVEDLPAMVAEAGFIGAMIALPGLPIVALAWLILADGRRVVLRTVLCILTVAGLAIGLGVMWLNAPDIEEACTLACIEAGAFLNGLITLGVVRACGYRLGRQPKRTDAVARLQGPSVHLPLSRWRLMVATAPMLAVAAVLACSLPERFEMWRRADVAAQWRETGVRVIFSDEGRITSAQCGGRSVSDDDLRRIAELADLESLDLEGTSIEDQQLALLSSLTTLRSLTLSRTRIVLPQSKVEERSVWVSINPKGGSYEETTSFFSRH
ncbi:MAG TPA: hypothetical protein VF306_16480 [Pirellulales bacterium]